jgi:23S rRNA (uracil1939-C5)-methyltransferase
MRPIDDEELLLEKLRQKLGPSKKQDDRAELERLFGKKEQTEEDRIRSKLVKPTVKAGDIIDITIEKIAFGGDGIGRYKNFPVFVCGVVPGDTVRVRLTHILKDMCRGEIIEFTSRSSNRVQPRCPYFGECGGCQFQNLVYTAQLKMKEVMASDIFSKIGGVDTRVRSVIGSPESYEYRIRTRLQASATKSNIQIGYFAEKSNRCIPIDQCPLLTKPLNNILKHLPELMPHPGTAPVPQEIHLHMSTENNSCAIHFSGSDTIFDIESIYNSSMRKSLPVTGVSSGCDSNYQYIGNDVLTHKTGRYVFDINTSSFFQINHFLHKKLIDQVIMLSSPSPGDTVLDLYSGCGFFSLPMAPFVQSVIGVDSNAQAIDCANRNSLRMNLSNSRFVVSDDKTFFQLPDIMNKRFSLVITDPPRKGLSSEAINGLLKLKPAKLMYISCDPATLARDLRKLCDGDFRVRVIQPIDLFPHTYHLECLVFLTHKFTGVQAANQAFADLR